jgi:catechol 2,3-dioxygenase-like lactoylglutathione lyase family enzyme
MPEVIFEGTTPILRVASVSASIEYYVNALGFTVAWQTDNFACVRRDRRCSLFLSEGDQGNFGTWVWIGVTDADALYQELLEKGARVRHRPTNYAWAYEMQVEDLDGNVLRMGSDSKDGETENEWLDMHGVLWVRTPEGGWTASGKRSQV